MDIGWGFFSPLARFFFFDLFGFVWDHKVLRGSRFFFMFFVFWFSPPFFGLVGWVWHVEELVWLGSVFMRCLLVSWKWVRAAAIALRQFTVYLWILEKI